ncbi:hypothetical protein EC973_003109 [Apophysomyces ossiformis]|uniref:YCII-related domain-containing protein n=1 Tax=Apophysomyces ossiformis TaxID=679940 RepID=A0A8H7EMI2_9FUNG|nr:hypothetical protein EC973_003109 [Apophysomyces ossiformis]
MNALRSIQLLNRYQSRVYSTQGKNLFLVIVHDYKDKDALQRRLNAREKHLERAKQSLHSGVIQSGGPLLDSHEGGKMVGSALVVQASSEAEVHQLIKDDPYIEGKVWEKWEIYPYKLALKADKA